MGLVNGWWLCPKSLNTICTLDAHYGLVAFKKKKEEKNSRPNTLQFFFIFEKTNQVTI